MGNIASGASCAHAPGATASDFFGGLAHGLLGLFGAGGLVDPLGNAQSAVQAALADINSTTASMSLAAAKNEQKITEDQYKALETHIQLSNQIVQDQNDQLWDAIKEENLFLIILSMLVVLLIFFFLIQKKCC